MDVVAQATGRAYGTMVASLAEQLASGALKVGDRLPTERELSDAYAISINSVRRGIELFVRQNILIRRRGSGMYVLKTVAPRPPVVDLDTVVVHYDVWFRRYHPYYSEVRRALRDTLPRLGWRVEVLVPDGDDPWQPAGDYAYVGVPWAVLRKRLQHTTRMAGAILSTTVAADLAPACAAVPVVVAGFHPDFAGAGHDWDDELTTAARALLRRGSRRLLVVGTAARTPAAAVELAAHAEECADELAAVTVVPAARRDSRLLSQVTRAAFDATARELARQREIDGIVAGSDFHAQGVFDAVSEDRRGNGRLRHVAALVNKESRLQTELAYDAVVLDGYADGMALAELMDSHLRLPETAPLRITLRGRLSEHRGQRARP